MLSRIIKLLPLALTSAALICLVIVFVGCTSPSSPTSLYFMKVDLTNFPQLGHLSLPRSLSSSLTGSAHKVAGAVSHASNAAEHKVNQASDSLQGDLKLHLPAYYTVGLWGYCEGQQSTAPYSHCSTPRASFLFDLLGISSSVSTQLDQLLPQGDHRVLSGFRDISRWSASAYILGFTAAVLAIVFEITYKLLSRGRKLFIVPSILASVFIIGASIAMTVIYSLIATDIEKVLQPLGAHASIGAQMFTATWLAGGFSIAASLTWLIETFCFCF